MDVMMLAVALGVALYFLWLVGDPDNWSEEFRDLVAGRRDIR